MNTNAYLEPVLWRKSPLPHHATWWSSVSAEAAIEFGRFRVLLRRRQLHVLQLIFAVHHYGRSLGLDAVFVARSGARHTLASTLLAEVT